MSSQLRANFSSFPPEFKTFVSTVVQPRQPLGIYVRASDSTVTAVERSSPFFGKLRAGAQLLEHNSKPFNMDELTRELAELNSQREIIFFARHTSFSLSETNGAAIERIRFNRRRQSNVGNRLVTTFKITLVDQTPQGLPRPILGLALTYDENERVKVQSAVPGSLAAIHLRGGDVVRQVDGRAVASISLASALIASGFQEKLFVVLLVEVHADGAEAAPPTMPSDVIITDRQIDLIRSGVVARMRLTPLIRPQPTPAPPPRRSTSFKEPLAVEVGIGNDDASSSNKKRDKNN